MSFGHASSMRLARLARCEAAEHDGMNGTDACACEHREHRFRHHRHVDEHAVATRHSERTHHRGAAVHFGVKLRVRVGPGRVDLGRDIHERILVAAFREMPVHGVVAEIGESAYEPPRERRSAVVEDALERRVPVDQTGFFAPEGLTLLDGAAMEFVICTHAVSSRYCMSRQRLHFIGRLVRASRRSAPQHEGPQHRSH